MSERGYKYLFIAGVVFLVFMAGSITAEFRLFPHNILENSYKGFRTVKIILKGNNPANEYMWAVPTHSADKSGMTIYEKGEAFEGYTLYAPSNKQEARLIDMDGNVVHRWAMPFSEVWERPPHIRTPVGDELIIWHGLHLFPNGDLLIVYNGSATPSGYGLVKIDKDSNILWKYEDHAHHTVEVGPDGKVYTLTLDLSAEPVPGAGHMLYPFLRDKIVILEPDGKHIKSISIINAFANAPDYRAVLQYIGNEKRNDIDLTLAERGDIIHANYIQYITAELAAAQPLFEEGQLIISLREIDTIAVIDPETSQVVWALRGYWRAQHHTRLLPNGNFMVFDNEGPQGVPGRSRIIEFNPATSEIPWFYEGTQDQPFYSWIRGSHDPLPNGNVLVTSYQNGRLFEVNRDKEIVWEYFVPDRLEGQPERRGGAHNGMRYAYNELTFLEENPGPGE